MTYANKTPPAGRSWCHKTGLRTPYRTRQRGISLFVVIVFVLLSMLLALWASRTSLFNEMVVGNDADYQRAFEAAQALLQAGDPQAALEKLAGEAAARWTLAGTVIIHRVGAMKPGERIVFVAHVTE